MSQENVNIQLGNLDFDSIKQSIIDHLKTQYTIKDYNYEGSAAQVLLDILAYNTLYYGYYANMVASEMFLDTAQKEESIISLVKPLGYVVPGKTSAKGKVNIRNGPENQLVERYTRFTGNSPSGLLYNFYTLSEHALDDQGENTLTITQGKSLIQEQPLIVDSETKRGFIHGLDIDISTIRVEVQESNGDWIPWRLVNNIQSGLDESSTVYWLERSELGFFIIFGGGYDSSYGQVGQTITPNQLVRVSYLKSDGESGNFVSNFKLVGDKFTATSETASGGISSGGLDKPNIEAVRFFAPKWFASQNRAVTLDDCRGILAESGFVTGDEDPYSRFTVWGGETMTPPRYGRLFVSLNESEDVDPVSSAFAIDILKSKTCVTIIPEFMNLETFKVMIGGGVLYEPNNSEHDENTLLSLIKDKISKQYNTRFNLENVNSSAIASVINSVDDSILADGNDINTKLIKEVVVDNGYVGKQKFNNSCKIGSFKTEYFTPHDNYIDDFDNPPGGQVRLVTYGVLDKNGFQQIKAETGSGWNDFVGRWHPLIGEVEILDSLFSTNTIDFEVEPYSLEIKENMYASVVTDIQMIQRN